MENDVLVYDYLVINYSPKRLRVHNKGLKTFKSIYMFNGIPYYASNKGDMANLSINLNKLISLVFNCEINYHSKMINKFLRIF